MQMQKKKPTRFTISEDLITSHQACWMFSEKDTSCFTAVNLIVQDNAFGVMQAAYTIGKIVKRGILNPSLSHPAHSNPTPSIWDSDVVDDDTLCSFQDSTSVAIQDWIILFLVFVGRGAVYPVLLLVVIRSSGVVLLSIAVIRIYQYRSRGWGEDWLWRDLMLNVALRAPTFDAGAVVLGECFLVGCSHPATNMLR